jgi:hypothetical protein
MAWRTHTIEVTLELLKSGVSPLTGRGFQFADRVDWHEGRPRTFRALWRTEQPSIQVIREDGLWRFRPEEMESARAGDRLVLYWEPKQGMGEAELQDGSTVMVRHFLLRADDAFVVALLEQGIPPGDEQVGPTHDRAGWEELRRRALALAEEAEARGIASLVAASRFVEDKGAVLELRGLGEPVEAQVLANDLLDVRRSRPPRGRRARPDYRPRLDADPLLKMLDSTAGAFGSLEETLARRETTLNLLQRITEGSSAE